MDIILIRHGETKSNGEKRYLGRTDEPLSEKGRRQAQAVKLPGVGRVYSSPYLRCLQTAKLIFPCLEPFIAPDLRECDFGIFEGKTADELADCPEYREWVEGGCTGPIPGGESVSEFQERCCKAFEKIVLAEAETGGTPALVAHGGVIMAILARFDVQKRDFYDYYIENCSYVSCRCATSGGISLFVTGGAP